MAELAPDILLLEARIADPDLRLRDKVREITFLLVGEGEPL